MRENWNRFNCYLKLIKSIYLFSFYILSIGEQVHIPTLPTKIFYKKKVLCNLYAETGNQKRILLDFLFFLMYIYCTPIPILYIGNIFQHLHKK